MKTSKTMMYTLARLQRQLEAELYRIRSDPNAQLGDAAKIDIHRTHLLALRRHLAGMGDGVAGL